MEIGTPLRERAVWRIEQGRAVRVADDLSRGPQGQRPRLDGVLPRSEFGIESHVTIAYLTFLVGLLDLYRTACRFAQDRRLGETGRRHKVDVLSDQLCELLGAPAHRRTPTVRHRVRHREKVTLLGSLTLSPARRRCGLHVDVLRTRSVTAAQLLDHLRRLRRTCRTPLVVVLDNFNTHRGRRLRRWVESIGDVPLEFLPPYAPELNAVEGAWSHGKCRTAEGRLVEDRDGLERLAHAAIENARAQHLLRGFIRATGLPLAFHLKRNHQSESL